MQIYIYNRFLFIKTQLLSPASLVLFVSQTCLESPRSQWHDPKYCPRPPICTCSAWGKPFSCGLSGPWVWETIRWWKKTMAALPVVTHHRKNHEHGSEHGRFEAFMKVVVRIEFERKSMCWKLFQRNWPYACSIENPWVPSFHELNCHFRNHLNPKSSTSSFAAIFTSSTLGKMPTFLAFFPRRFGGPPTAVGNLSGPSFKRWHCY